MDAVEGLRTLFVSFTGGILLLDSTTALQKRFVAYGPRLGPGKSSSLADASGKTRNAASIAGRTLDWTASFTVTHQWFYHFYVLSVFGSLFWASQTRYPTRRFETVLLYAAKPDRPSMSANQVALLWLMMLIQGSRRLYECLAFDKPSASRMWIGHWVLGLAFYAAMSFAVWIEGTAMIRTGVLLRQLTFSTPSVKTFLAVPVFLLASGLQNDCHNYLANLKKYSLPSHPAFQRLIAPHYFAECLIYVSLAVAGAPCGALVNRTLLTALVFVVVNLGITSYHSRRWYAQKFGQDAVVHKWNMVPYVY